MLKNLLFLLFIFSFINDVNAANNYQCGDSLYVWAKVGLNLRFAPTTTSKIIAKLPFGELVKIKEKINKPIHIELVSNTNNKFKTASDPLIIYGNWVRVENDLGIEGYVIDQYLLFHKPYIANSSNALIWPFKLIKTDTLGTNDELIVRIKQEYEGGIEINSESGAKGGLSTYLFPDWTVEDVLVFMCSDENFYDRILKNWKEEIIIAMSDICYFHLKLTKKGVRVEINCSC